MKLGVASLALSLVLAATAQDVPPTADWSKALAYPLKELTSGAHTSLGDLKGKYKAILIESYASWCPDCKRAMPEVLKLRRAVSAKDVLFVGLDVWDSWRDLRAHQAKNHLPYLILHDPAEKNAKASITQALGITNIPTVVILNGRTMSEKGRFVDEKTAHSDEELETLRALGVRVLSRRWTLARLGSG